MFERENDFLIGLADNGIGIEDQYKDQIFDIFKRLDKKKSTGTGIGLSICKKITQTYLGNIWVSDNKPHGSLFEFNISKNNIAN